MTKADACVAINQYRWSERVGDTPITQRQETIDIVYWELPGSMVRVRYGGRYCSIDRTRKFDLAFRLT